MAALAVYIPEGAGIGMIMEAGFGQTETAVIIANMAKGTEVRAIQQDPPAC